MEDNIIKNDENLDSIKDDFTPPGGKKNPDEKKESEKEKNNGADESVTLTQKELDKRIQSAEDKLRTSYSKTIKELEGKIKDMSPVEKSETELEIEKRLAELENAKKEVDAQKAFFTLQESLQSKGINKSIASYLKADVDVEEFSKVYTEIVKDNIKLDGYSPDNHKSGDKITPEEFKSMKYSEKEKIMRESPELYKRLMAKIKR